MMTPDNAGLTASPSLPDKFGRIAAQLVSYLFHPLLMPTWILFLFFQQHSYLALLTKEVQRLFYIYFLLATFLIPVTVIPLLVNLGYVKTLQMYRSRERRVPLLFTAFAYFITFFLLGRFPFRVPEIIRFLPLAAGIAILLATIVSNYWKISLHMVGVGGATGAVLALGQLYMNNPQPQMLAAILASGILGSARLGLKAHSPAQVYTGYLLGVLVVFAVLYAFC